jgi:response regulator RpfG family c-di-GMP phosphodiesterase
LSAFAPGAGTQFDPDVVAAFLSTLGEILEIRERHSTEKRLSLEAFAVA